MKRKDGRKPAVSACYTSMPLNRRRWLPLALLVMLLGLIGVVGVRGWRVDGGRELAAGKVPAVGSGEERVDRDGRSSGRERRSAASAEAKLKSLLAVREGEVAFIRVPAALMPRLTGAPEGGPHEEETAPGDRVPGLMGILNREMVRLALTGRAEEIEGGLDASGGSFEWLGPGLEISGTSSRDGDFMKVDLTATEGRGKMTMKSSVPPGSVMVLRSTGPDPEGVLIVIGGDDVGELPAGDWGD